MHTNGYGTSILGTVSMKVINFFGAPSSGKSTQAAGLFYEMKRHGDSVELINEFPKQCVWEGHINLLEDQLYVLGQQHRQQARLEGKVKYCITDSPVLLSPIYRDVYEQVMYTEQLITQAASDCFNKYDNINIFMRICPDDFQEKGRAQDLKQCIEIDQRIEDMLKSMGLDYMEARFDQPSTFPARFRTYVKQR